MTAGGARPDADRHARAATPDAQGVVDRDGVAIHWERYGTGSPAIVFAPTWSIVDSRCWKQQVPEFARRHQVITFDPRGNGRSDRPTEPMAYFEQEFASDMLAVMDAVGVQRAVIVALSLGAQRSLIVAGERPERVHGLVLVGPSLPFEEQQAVASRFTVDLGIDEGWDRYNAHSLRRDYRGFVEFFFGQVFTEPHSTKQIEDCVGWALGTDAETLIAAEVAELDPDRTRQLSAAVGCPVLVIHGDADAIVPVEIGAAAAALTGGRLVVFAGSGHCPQARDPVRFNLELRAFVEALPITAEDRA